jgi:hypothetical protein
MGFQTEINYILKSSKHAESVDLHTKKVGDTIFITKRNARVYIINVPIMFADNEWQILGMCIVQTVEMSPSQTIVVARILTLFSETESKVVTRLVREAEEANKR